MQLLHTLLHDYLFLIPLVVMILGEIVKMLVENVRSGKWHLALFRPGGFPSSHSAFVTSLLIIVWYKLGLQSVEFAMSFVFAGIVWYDAMSVRRAVGEQAKALNQLQNTALVLAEFCYTLTQLHKTIAGKWRQQVLLIQ